MLAWTAKLKCDFMLVLKTKNWQKLKEELEHEKLEKSSKAFEGQKKKRGRICWVNAFSGWCHLPETVLTNLLFQLFIFKSKVVRRDSRARNRKNCFTVSQIVLSGAGTSLDLGGALSLFESLTTSLSFSQVVHIKCLSPLSQFWEDFTVSIVTCFSTLDLRLLGKFRLFISSRLTFY